MGFYEDPQITEADNGKVLGVLNGVAVWVNGGSAPAGDLTTDDITMAENITLAGNYTQIGNWTKTQNGTAVKEVAGMTLTEELKAKFRQHKAFSKLVFQSGILTDIVLDEEKKAAWEAEKSAETAQPMSNTPTLADRVSALEAKVAKLEGGGA